jgi:uncharacterized protein (DUF433 family)/DNA-binding transcriptional MerR regulator
MVATMGFGVGAYSPSVAARVARIEYQNFQAWAKANLLHPTPVAFDAKRENIYTYRDLLLIRLIMRLREKGVRTKEIKAALETIEMMSGGDRDAWMKATIIVTDGVVAVFFPDKPEWNPVAAALGTQKMAVVFFPNLINELKEELLPADRFPYIEIDPEVLGGAPVIKGTRITTRAIASVRESGENPKEAYPSLTDQQIANAEAYEEFLAQT